VAVCTFFGHRDCPETIKSKLRETLIELVEHDGVDSFYVGNQGAFDAMARSVLRELALEYSHISYAVVLAYMPTRRNEYDDYSDTMLPEGIETVPKRFAISWRNKWMLRQSDYVVTYITHSWGGAAQFAELAERKGRKVINIAD
jgi:uncharacterized phage-like protein YoqJ